MTVAEFTYDITRDFDAGFYDGIGTTGDTPAKWDVAINGRGYMLDTNHPAFGGQSAYLGRMGIETIPYIRTQADNSDEPGAATLNPDDLWTRAQSSFHHGAGQLYLDAPESDRDRFRASFGIDPWTKGKLQLLNTVSSIYASTNVNMQVIRVGTFLYLADNQTLKYANAPYSSWTASTIAPSQQIYSICSDGYTIYAACGSAGVYSTHRGTNAADTSYNALACTLIAYVNGRLMAANGAAIYNITSGSTPTALYTQPNSDFTWVGFAEGQSCIYAAGFSGDKSIVYRTAIKSDGTGLDAVVVAGVLPDGEIVKSIQSYLGFIVVGTTKGLRMATADSTGNLTFGALITTNTTIRCFEPNDRFVWFGYENYDTSHTGLGRVDLSVVDTAGAPAYATDIMAGSTASPIQGAVTSVATDSNNKRVFAVQGVGLFLETSTQVSSGTLDTGQLQYGVVAPKVALRVGVKHKPLPTNGAVSVSVAPDDGSLVFVGSSAVAGTTTTDKPLSVPELAAVLFELHIELDNGAVLEHYEFKAYPTAPRGREIRVPILLHETVTTATGDEVSLDTRAEYDYLESLVGQDRLNSYQELSTTYSAFVEDEDFQRFSPTSDREWWNGTLLLVLKVLGD